VVDVEGVLLGSIEYAVVRKWGWFRICRAEFSS